MVERRIVEEDNQKVVEYHEDQTPDEVDLQQAIQVALGKVNEDDGAERVAKFLVANEVVAPDCLGQGRQHQGHQEIDSKEDDEEIHGVLQRRQYIVYFLHYLSGVHQLEENEDQTDGLQNQEIRKVSSDKVQAVVLLSIVLVQSMLNVEVKGLRISNLKCKTCYKKNDDGGIDKVLLEGHETHDV